MKGFLRFLVALLAILIVVALALVILDLTSYAHNPDNATAYAVDSGVRSLFPVAWLTRYDGWRASFLVWLSNVLDFAREAA